MFENIMNGAPLPEPLGMHADFETGFAFGIIVLHDETARYFVRWCRRNKCGGVYDRTQNRWTLTVPIAFDDFLELLKTDGIVTTESAGSLETRRWIRACRPAGNDSLDRH